MKRVVIVTMALALSLAFNLVTPAAQSPGPCIPPGEWAPTLPGEIRSARELFRRIDGDASLHFRAFEFDSKENASAALPLIVDEIVTSTEDSWRGELNLAPTSARALGDESFVLSGMVRSRDGYADAAIVLAVVRSGHLVWIGKSTAIDDSFELEDVMVTLETIVGRSPTASVELVDGKWVGGAFAMLPQLSDMPEGYKEIGVC